MVQAYWVARHHRFKRDLEALPEGVEAIVLPIGQTRSLRFNDFTQSGELIQAAYAATSASSTVSSTTTARCPPATGPRCPRREDVRVQRDGRFAGDVRGARSPPPVRPRPCSTDEPADASEPRSPPRSTATATPAGRAIAAVVAAAPRSLEGWARLGDAGRDVMERYAAYRVGYHRGLDRSAPTDGGAAATCAGSTRATVASSGRSPGLQRTAAEIGEDDEAERCALFLRQLDPAWPPADLG